VIEVEGLAKRYGSRVALDGVSFSVRPGLVTGFLGPNGSGKSTTMRLVLGLDRPGAGRALVNGRRYAEFSDPLRQLGAMLETRAAHPRRTAFDHLLAIAATHGITRARVHEVIELAGLEDVSGKRVGAFSLGMAQRLGIATALLGDPQALMLDEPVNGLDPEGVVWIRQLCRDFAAMGRTVFLSSHLMSEIALVADHLIVLGRGRVLADGPLDALLPDADAVKVRTPRAPELAALIARRGGAVRSGSTPGELRVELMSAAEVGRTAADAGIALEELVQERVTLEEAYLTLTADAVEHRAERTLP